MAARDPRILLNEAIRSLDGQPLSAFTQTHTFDTYEGQNCAPGLDWYALHFPHPVTFNCVEMTMGFA
jgi:hypothetical protein